MEEKEVNAIKKELVNLCQLLKIRKKEEVILIKKIINNYLFRIRKTKLI